MSDVPASELATDTADAEETELIRFESVTKQFGSVTAVDDVSFSVRDNEIIAIVGDNGAGKSTLMKMLAGAHKPTTGAIYYDGEQVAFANPGDARDAGIETIYQDLALMDDLDIATNIHLEKFPKKLDVGPLEMIDWEQTYADTVEILEYLNQDLNPELEVEWLSGGERQLVAIARAILFAPEVIILDEPTSALSVAGTELVKDTMLQLKDEGHTQLIVTHNFEEVLDIADRIAVLYRGELVDVLATDEATKQELTNMLTTGTRSPDLEDVST